MIPPFGSTLSPITAPATAPTPVATALPRPLPIWCPITPPAMPPTIAPNGEPPLVGPCVVTDSFQHSCLGAFTRSYMGVVATTGAWSVKSVASATHHADAETAVRPAAKMFFSIICILSSACVWLVYRTTNLATSSHEPEKVTDRFDARESGWRGSRGAGSRRQRARGYTLRSGWTAMLG